MRSQLIRTLAVVTAALALAAGCSAGADPGPAPSSASPGVSAPAPTTTAPPAGPGPLTGSGVGPYQLDAAQDSLTSGGSLANVTGSAGCPDFVTADATGAYAGAVSIVFFQHKVSWIEVTSPIISTVEGAKVGMTAAQVKGLYPAAVELTGGPGKALGVSGPGAAGLLFRLNSAGAVQSIEAGRYETLEFRFTDGEGC
ncbi:MAG TPA: hypothetical protein VF163_10400 [Micromonosporaceae bacterium]